MRKDQITAMMNSKVPTDAELAAIIKKFDDAKTKESTDMQATYDKISCLKVHCQLEEFGGLFADEVVKDKCGEQAGAKYCDALNKAQSDMAGQMQDSAQKQNQYDAAKNQLLASHASSDSLSGILKQIEDEINDLEDQLKTAPKELPVPKDNNTMSQQELDDNWMSFSFDSEESKTSVDTSSKVYKAAASFHASGWFWHAGGSVSHSSASQNFDKDMQQAGVNVAAKLLRVTFSRNWFRPSLFSHKHLGMVCEIILVHASYP